MLAVGRAARRPLRDERAYGEIVITADELSALALAADPDTSVPDDAVPFDLGAGDGDGLLPVWYFPVPAGRQVRGWRRRMVLLLAGSFLLVSACGLCCTYGALVMA
jgi:hypothetical protein